MSSLVPRSAMKSSTRLWPGDQCFRQLPTRNQSIRLDQFEFKVIHADERRLTRLRVTTEPLTPQANARPGPQLGHSPAGWRCFPARSGSVRRLADYPLSAGLHYTALNRTQRAGGIDLLRRGLLRRGGLVGVYVSIHVYGNTPVWLAAGLTTVFCGSLGLLFAAQGMAFARLASRHPSWRAAQFASLWVIFEWLRGWLLTGFPWLYAGYGALDSPLAGWIPVVGSTVRPGS